MHAFIHEILGFTDEAMSLNSLCMRVLQEPTPDTENTPQNLAAHVHCWLYRSVSGHKLQFICEYWFHDGTQDAAEIYQQFERVIHNCEMQELRVHGLVCDAGGANPKFYHGSL